MSSKTPYQQIAEVSYNKVENESLTLSFEYIDWDSEEFFFHSMDQKYYKKFFNCLSNIQKCAEKDIREQPDHHCLTPKSIFNTGMSSKKSFPESTVELLKEKLRPQFKGEDSALDSEAREIANIAFEVSLGKNYGRIHGFLWNNRFCIVWFDPCHNLYPKDKKMTKPIKNGFSVEKFNELNEKLVELQKKNDELTKTNSELHELLDEKTKP
jgi:alkylhydroperoxidase/carboxymuconolactone decarboxylase family protein YurZ